MSSGDRSRAGRAAWTRVAAAMALAWALVVGGAVAPSVAADTPVVKLATFTESTIGSVAQWDKAKPPSTPMPTGSRTLTFTFTLQSTDPGATTWSTLWLRVLAIRGATQNVIAATIPVTGATVTYTVPTAFVVASGTTTFRAILNTNDVAVVDYDASYRQLELDILGEAPAPVAGTVAISGTPQPGQTLTAQVSGWTNVSTYSYQWYRSGVPVGTNSSSYALTAADAGHSLTVEVTGSGDGGTDSATSAPVVVNSTTTTYTGDTIAIASEPSTLSATVTAAAGGPVSSGTVSFVHVEGGVDIGTLGTATVTAGVATTTATLPADWDATSRVEARYAGSGGFPASTSAPATIERFPAILPGTPEIQAGGAAATEAIAGVPLTVDPGSWGPPGTTFSIEWLVLDGATERSVGTGVGITPDAADAGLRLIARVTGSYPGLSPVTIDSADVPILRATTTQLTSAAVAPVGIVDLLVEVGGVAGAVGEVRVVATPVGGGMPVERYVPLPADGRVSTFLILGAAGDYALAAEYSDASGENAASSDLGAIRIVDALTPPAASALPATTPYGAAISAPDTGAGWDPTVAEGTTLDYEWFRDDGSGWAPVGTGRDYTPSPTEVGASLRVRITGQFGPYSASADSLPTVVNAPTTTVLTPDSGVWRGSPGADAGFTVEVSSPAGAVGIGIVNLLDAGSTVLATAPVVGGRATFTVMLPGAAGPYGLRAEYADGTSTFAASADDGTVDVLAISPATPVIVVGMTPATVAQVGVAHSVDTGSWTPLDVALAPVWYIVDGATRTAVGTGPDYTPTAADAGKRLVVEIEGTAAGLAPVTVGSAELDVRIPTQTTIELPDGVLRAPAGTTRDVTIHVTAPTGPATSGTVTLVGPAGVIGTAPVAADGTAVLPVTFGDLSVGLEHYSATYDGGASLFLASDASVDVQLVGDLAKGLAGLLGARSGVAGVGAALLADASGWPTGVTFAYRWLRDGTPIPGATAATFTPGSGDVGHELSVLVTASLPGYDPVDVTVGPVRVVSRGAWLAVTGGAGLAPLAVAALALAAAGIALLRLSRGGRVRMPRARC